MSSLSLIDLGMLGAILLLGSKGYFSGWSRELAALIGLMGGLAVSTRVAPVAADALRGFLPSSLNPALIQLALFALLLAVIWGGVTLIERRLEGERFSPLSLPSRLAGWAIASLKYLMILGVAISIAMHTPSLRKSIQKRLGASALLLPLEKLGTVIVRPPQPRLAAHPAPAKRRP